MESSRAPAEHQHSLLLWSLQGAFMDKCVVDEEVSSLVTEGRPGDETSFSPQLSPLLDADKGIKPQKLQPQPHFMVL